MRDAAWIWDPALPEGPHQYVCFRRDFLLGKRVSGRADLEIAAGSDYIAWVNGVEAGRGQYSDWPQRKTSTVLPVQSLLRPGRNLLAVLVYHRGADSSDHRAGPPGLRAVLTAGRNVLVTDRNWRCLPHPAFRAGPMPKVSVQMGFTAEFDARRDLDWQCPGFNDSAWHSAAIREGVANPVHPRPVPSCRILPPLRTTVCMHGDFLRGAPLDTVARTMSADALVSRRVEDVFEGQAGSEALTLPAAGGGGLVLLPPAEGFTGRFLVVDCGREEVGLLALCVQAPAGTVLDIGHGEHLDDGRVRTAVGGRNFADRYICRQGDQEFTLPFRRLGARYLELHISGTRGPVRISYLGLRPVEYPVSLQGDFRSGDRLADETWRIGRRTLQLCLHEHYEDCPWREQALYAFDSRNQALCGYQAFGNYDFAEASLALLGEGYHEWDGLLELCAPARVGWPSGESFLHINIPVFTLVWIVELAEHWMHSGRGTLFRRFRRQVLEILQRMERLRSADTGLYRLPDVPGIWHFYEWAPGLSGRLGDEKPGGRVDAPFNLFLHEALGACSWMLAEAGEMEEAAVLRRRQEVLGMAVRRSFWDPARRLFASYLDHGRREHYAELVQMLMLKAGLVAPGKVSALLRAMDGSDCVPMTLSSRIYQVFGLMPQGVGERWRMAESLQAEWSAMVLKGATSFWETARGGDDFDAAGSLCHGWSALPVYYYQAWVLGVRPLRPGFRQFLVQPYPDRFSQAEGVIPTPSGRIRVRWERRGKGLAVEVSGPAALEPKFQSYPEARIVRASYNGKSF